MEKKTKIVAIVIGAVGSVSKRSEDFLKILDIESLNISLS